MFLSAVQIGVTVAGFFSSAYGAATLAPGAAAVLVDWGAPERGAEVLAVVGTTLVIAYVSLVIGELVPKRLAMQRAEAFTRVLAPPLRIFAAAMRPVIWLLSVSTDAVVRLLRGDPKISRAEQTVEQLRDLLLANRSLHPEHRRVLADVFAARDRLLREVMRPRTYVAFLAGDQTAAEARRLVLAMPYTRYPVAGASTDDVVGFVHLRDLFEPSEGQATVAQMTHPMLALPSTNRVLPSLLLMRRGGHRIALVVDEYGGTDGIVTMEDLVEEVLGEMSEQDGAARASSGGEAAGLEPGEGLELDGALILQEASERLGWELPDEGRYETLAGFFVDRLGTLAHEGTSYCSRATGSRLSPWRDGVWHGSM